MKEYIEPKMEMITYFTSDIIASSQPRHGTETGNEFDDDFHRATEETTLPDWITPIDDDDW